MKKAFLYKETRKGTETMMHSEASTRERPRGGASTMGLWELVGFGVTALGGTLLHFLYDLTGGARWAALISGVNESTWEHMKLLFWPAFLFALVQWGFYRDRKDFWCVKLGGIWLGLLLIPVLFYTYNGTVGRSPDWLNVTIFFISAAAAFWYETKRFRANDTEPSTSCRFPRASFWALCALGILFVLFTFRTPELGIFRDPLTGTYGI